MTKLLNDSPKQIHPKTPAPNGPKAQYKPTVSALVYFCATGCKVKPKQLHTIASKIIASHASDSEGNCGVSKMQDAMAEKLPIVPSWTIPTTKAFSSLAISFDLDTSVSGEFNYELKISSDDDTSKFNNSYLFNQTVAEKVKMLFITEVESDKQAAIELYGDTCEIDFNNKKDVPYTIEDLSKYDEFVLSNVDIRNLNNYSQFIDSLDTLVSKFGKSLITFGNTYIQNNYDDPTLSVLNNMLPVKFGND